VYSQVTQVTAGLVYTTRDTTRATASIITAQRWCTPHAPPPLLQSSQRSSGVHHTRHCLQRSAGVHHTRHCWWQHWCTPHAPLLAAQRWCTPHVSLLAALRVVYTSCSCAASSTGVHHMRHCRKPCNAAGMLLSLLNGSSI